MEGRETDQFFVQSFSHVHNLQLLEPDQLILLRDLLLKSQPLLTQQLQLGG